MGEKTDNQKKTDEHQINVCLCKSAFHLDWGNPCNCEPCHLPSQVKDVGGVK